MLTKSQRPLNEDERQRLNYMQEHVLDPVPAVAGIASFNLRWIGISIGILALCVFLFIKGLHRGGDSSVIWARMAPLAFIFGVLALFSAFIAARSFFGLTFGRQQFARDLIQRIRVALENGKASVCSVKSNRVIVIEETKDAGVAFIYDLGDGTSFYLRSDDYDYYPESTTGTEKPWPAHRFDIVRSSANDLLVGVFGAREQLEPSQTVPITEMPHSFLSAEEPKTETILPGSPEEILKRLGHRPAHEKE